MANWRLPAAQGRLERTPLWPRRGERMYADYSQAVCHKPADAPRRVETTWPRSGPRGVPARSVGTRMRSGKKRASKVDINMGCEKGPKNSCNPLHSMDFWHNPRRFLVFSHNAARIVYYRRMLLDDNNAHTAPRSNSLLEARESEARVGGQRTEESRMQNEPLMEVELHLD